MAATLRLMFPWIALCGMLAAGVWAFSFQSLPPADFTFANSTEIESTDPAIVTGAPEGRVIYSIYEALLGFDPETLEASTEFGVAESWEVSDDLTVYTFKLRDEACWTNGETTAPIIAEDFAWSWMRMLHPETAAQYAYQLYYIKNASKFNTGQVEVGDPVEVELYDRPIPTQTFPRGTILHGECVSIETQENSEDAIYTIQTDEGEKRFIKNENPSEGVTAARNILFDFQHVGVKALNEKTLEITLNYPTPFFPKLMAFYPLSPVNRESIEKHGYPGFTKPENLVNNGPYRISFRRLRDRIRLVKNKHYWRRDKVELEIVDILAVENTQTSLNLYLTGELDWSPDVPVTMIPTLLERYQDLEYKAFNPQPFLGCYYYMLNTTHEALQKEKVRRALNLALNKEEIVSRITGAGEVAAYSYVPPGIAGYERAFCEQYNPEKAKELLAEAGYPNAQGFPVIEIMYNTHEAHRSIAETIQAQWKRTLGINVRLANQEWGSYLDTRRNLEYNVARAAWIGDYVDPNTFLDMFVTDGENNQTGWSNKQYDQYIEEATREKDAKKRMEILHQAEILLMKEMPIIPIYYYVDKNIVQPYVTGFYRNLQDVHPVQFLGIDKEKKARFTNSEIR
ncbi:Oligopeptide ABC transporter, periplasmic oligopeptide-binding protein OppA [Planctomycetales bacterium 10988]|nr:Oligopeptide ABC transporter, periplasmic oligopeptide-binding protein OppA [Planctomycetales bacterium 10988]